MRPGHIVHSEQIKSVDGRPWQRAGTDAGFIKGEQCYVFKEPVLTVLGRAALC